jgi:superfamily II DNA/RNA helicase
MLVLLVCPAGYLLPILSRMYHYQTARREIPCPLAAVVVPTPELAHQVNSVYQSLAVSKWHSSVAHAESRLQLTQSTHLVILTGSTLHRYFFPRVFKELKILVFDETDMLLTGSERSTCWKLLNYFKETLLSTHVQQKELNTGSELDPFNCSSNNVSRASSSLPALMCHQFIFVGATLPARGRMTVDARIRRWAPSDSLFITTEGTHRTISEAQFEFIKAESKQEKNAALLSIFRDFENRKQGQSFSLDNGDHETTSVSDTLGGKGRNVAGDSILVFCDDETTVESVHATLTTSAAYRSHRNVGKLHAGLPIHERLGVIQEFRKGKIKVLICTNILSRGLDMPNVGMVIQYDCPRNVADFLHRSGRTARLKRMGKVVCFYDGSSKPVVELIQEAIDNNEMTFDHLFSRNKMLGRKLKRRAQKSRHPRQESN